MPTHNKSLLPHATAGLVFSQIVILELGSMVDADPSWSLVVAGAPFRG